MHDMTESQLSESFDELLDSIERIDGRITDALISELSSLVVHNHMPIVADGVKTLTYDTDGPALLEFGADSGDSGDDSDSGDSGDDSDSGDNGDSGDYDAAAELAATALSMLFTGIAIPAPENKSRIENEERNLQLALEYPTERTGGGELPNASAFTEGVFDEMPDFVKTWNEDPVSKWGARLRGPFIKTESRSYLYLTPRRVRMLAWFAKDVAFAFRYGYSLYGCLKRAGFDRENLPDAEEINAMAVESGALYMALAAACALKPNLPSDPPSDPLGEVNADLVTLLNQVITVAENITADIEDNDGLKVPQKIRRFEKYDPIEEFHYKGFHNYFKHGSAIPFHYITGNVMRLLKKHSVTFDELKMIMSLIQHSMRGVDYEVCLKTNHEGVFTRPRKLAKKHAECCVKLDEGGADVITQTELNTAPACKFCDVNSGISYTDTHDELSEFAIYLVEKRPGAPASEPRICATVSPLRSQELRQAYKLNEGTLYLRSHRNQGYSNYTPPVKMPLDLLIYLRERIVYQTGDGKTYYTYDLEDPVNDYRIIAGDEVYPYFKQIKAVMKFLTRRVFSEGGGEMPTHEKELKESIQMLTGAPLKTFTDGSYKSFIQGIVDLIHNVKYDTRRFGQMMKVSELLASVLATMSDLPDLPDSLRGAYQSRLASMLEFIELMEFAELYGEDAGDRFPGDAKRACFEQIKSAMRFLIRRLYDTLVNSGGEVSRRKELYQTFKDLTGADINDLTGKVVSIKYIAGAEFKPDRVSDISHKLVSLVNPDNAFLTNPLIKRAYKIHYDRLSACHDDGDRNRGNNRSNDGPTRGKYYGPRKNDGTTRGECVEGIRQLLIIALSRLGPVQSDNLQQILDLKRLEKGQENIHASLINVFKAFAGTGLKKEFTIKDAVDLVDRAVVNTSIADPAIARWTRLLGLEFHSDKDSDPEALEIYKHHTHCSKDLQRKIGGGKLSFKSQVMGLGLCLLAAVASITSF
jgi:hypothetical protein